MHKEGKKERKNKRKKGKKEEGKQIMKLALLRCLPFFFFLLERTDGPEKKKKNIISFEDFLKREMEIWK